MAMKLKLDEYEILKEICLELINEYHKNDVDKGGNPYINHLLSVSSICDSFEAKLSSLLHDILEDTPCTKDILHERGIPKNIIEIIDIVTRKKDESYNEFIDRIILSKNIYALELKCADIKDNCNLNRLNNTSVEEIKKAEKRILKRYKPSLLKIEEALSVLKNKDM